MLILMPGANAPQFFRELAQPAWNELRQGTAVGVLNCTIPAPLQSRPAYAAIARGSRRGVQARTEVKGIGDVLVAAGRRVAYVGHEGVVVDDRGFPRLDVSKASAAPGPALGTVVPLSDPPVRHDILWPMPGAQGFAVRTLLKNADLVVVDYYPRSDAYPSERNALELFTDLSRTQAPGDLLVLAGADPGQPHAGVWRYLAPVLIRGGGWSGSIPTSSTTRTPGLLANIDIAPTLLNHLGVPIPKWMDGHAAKPTPGSFRQVRELSEHALATRDLMAPGLIGWGALGVLGLALTTGLLFGAGRGAAPPAAGLRAARLLLLATACGTSAMLLTALFPAASMPELAIRFVVAILALTGLALAVGGGAPLLFALSLATVLLVGDLLLRLGMTQRNIMSDFANIGARFYGIGNEWEGMLLGTTLLIPFWLRQRQLDDDQWSEADLRKPFTPQLWVISVILWLATLIAVAHPAFGADFGGAVVMALAYVLAAGLFALPPRTRREAALRILGAFLVAALVAAGLIALDLARPATSRTHVGELAARAIAGEWGTVLETIVRKLQMNFAMALSPYFVGTLAIVVPLLAFWYSRVGPRARQALAGKPVLNAGLRAVMAGGLVGLVLNDTGVVTWAVASGAALVTWLDLLLESELETIV